MMTHTHTYAILHVQESSYRDVRRCLLIASPDHKDAIHNDNDDEVIDMQGIALQAAVLKQTVEQKWYELGAASRRAGLLKGECPVKEIGGLGDEWRKGWMDEYRNETQTLDGQQSGQ